VCCAGIGKAIRPSENNPCVAVQVLESKCDTSENNPCVAVQVLESKFGVPGNQIRAYVHYQPSYYHFHVHFAHTSLDLGGGSAVGKAHLLDDIIGAPHTTSQMKPFRLEYPCNRPDFIA
jgi:hypothetical protein